jgi:hypothetical protein
MRATLIEVDAACPPGYWYSTLAGQRLWAQEGRGFRWLILPGQGVASHPEPVIFSEHAWQVREGEVELRLHVVPGTVTQLGLGVGV